MKPLITGIKKILRQLELGWVIGFFQRLNNAWFLFRVAIKVVSWDRTGLFSILEAWLSRMKESHKRDTWHPSAPRAVKEIAICQELCRRLANEDCYTESFHDEHDKRWGKLNHISTPLNDGSNCYSVTFSRSKAITKEQKELERKEFRKLMDHENYLYNQDLELLFKMFRKHLRSWWT